MRGPFFYHMLENMAANMFIGRAIVERTLVAVAKRGSRDVIGSKKPKKRRKQKDEIDDIFG